MSLKIFWTPLGITLDTIREKRLVDITDGDTPNIRMDVRMLSIDTPEKAPTGTIRNAEELQDLFLDTAAWIKKGESPVGPDLAKHLAPRLARADAVAAHFAQGAEATAAHERLAKEKLKRPKGPDRSLFVRVADERFDQYGRLLAYVAPNYSAEERRKLSRRERATFNFLMVSSGWAASFVIFPSIPGEGDLGMFIDEAKAAAAKKRGAWADPLMLAGYEFRMCERLAALRKSVKAGRTPASESWHGWIERYCVDMTTAELYAPQDYVKVKPWNRLFLWPNDVRRAVSELNLAPAGRLAEG
jgi:endonuclease YncB( thermonuclease family)